jgi:hypothetical protein
VTVAKRVRRAVAIALAPLVLGLVPASASKTVAVEASPGRLRVSDATGDVVGLYDGVAFPKVKNIDIVRVRVTHSRRIEVRIRVADLKRPKLTNPDVSIKTPTGMWSLVRFGGDIELWKNSQQKSCNGLRDISSADKDMIWLSAPRRCLKFPAWVRVHADLTQVDKETDVIMTDALKTPHQTKPYFTPRLSFVAKL